jgi:hypothetical protein
MVVVQIDSENRLEPTKEEVEAGEGFIPRQVSLSVKKVLWSRSGTPALAPTSMTWTSGGWVFQGTMEQPLRRDSVPWLIPGHTYLVPITFTALSPNSSERATWIPLGSENAMPFDGGVVGRGEKIMIGSTTYNGSKPTGETAMRDFAWSKTAAEITAKHNNSQPDPAAEKYMNLSPIDRYAAVQETSGGGDNPDPREKQGSGSIPTKPTGEPS